MRSVSAETRKRTLPARIAAVLVLVVGAIVVSLYVVQHRSDAPLEPLLAGALAVAFFIARLVPVRLPQGDEVCVSLMVGVSALGVVPVEAAVAAALVAGLLEAAARFQQQPLEVTLDHGLDALRAAAVVGLISPWQLVLQPRLQADSASETLILLVLLAGLCYVAADLLTLAVPLRLLGEDDLLGAVRSLARPLLSVYLVHLAMAAVALRVYPSLGLWALLITLLLTLILQNSFSLYLRIRRAYGETIGALARAAELDRPQDSGHAQRVADLAVAVARHMGLSSHELELVGYAALLHDIGRIGYAADEQDVGHASRGAEIVASIPFLADVAPLIEAHHGNASAPLGAIIIGVCSEYDRLRRLHSVDEVLAPLLADAQGVHRQVVRALEEVVRSPHLAKGARS